MATNDVNSKQARKGPTKPRAASGSQASNSKPKAPPKASAGKENAQPRQETQSGPSIQGRLSKSSMGLQSAPSGNESTTLEAVLQRLEVMEGRLRREQEEKQELQSVIEALHAGGGDEDMVAEVNDPIPRPAGTSGKDWGLQIKMGLSGSPNKEAKYAALLRGLRDLVLNSGMKWEIGWKEIPATEKSRAFRVARERYPILNQYANDWATAEIIKQYIKNKRAHHYNCGWLAVPEKYAYLKQNASKREPTGSRSKRVKVEMAAKRKDKRRESLAVRLRRDTGENAGVGMDIAENEPFDEEVEPSSDEERDQS